MAIPSPETADTAFGSARALNRVDAAAAEDHDRGLVFISLDRALDERADHAVLHRDEARRAHHVRLLEAQRAAALVVVLVAEGNPAELGLPRALGHHGAHGEAVPELL